MKKVEVRNTIRQQASNVGLAWTTYSMRRALFVGGFNLERLRADRCRELPWRYSAGFPADASRQLESRRHTRPFLTLGLRPLSKMLALSGLLLMVIAGRAEERLDLGVRSGFSFSSGSHTFWQAEALASWRLPWTWETRSARWYAEPRLDLTAGALQGCEKSGFVGTLGPNVFGGYRGFPLSINLGFSPTLLSRGDYDCRSFGIPFQITSHAGIEWALGSRWHLGYRIQHMSNGGLGSPNPGLNMNMFSLSFGF